MYPGAYLNVDDPEQMTQYLFEGFDPTLRDQLGDDTILVVGCELRHRLVARARAAGDEGVGDPRRRRAELRAHLLPQLRQPRTAIVECPGAAEAARPGSEIRSTPIPGSSRSTGKDFRQDPSRHSCSSCSRRAGSSPGRRSGSREPPHDRPRHGRRLAGRPPDGSRRPLGGVRARVGRAATPRRTSLVLATERHDDGWAVWEQAPLSRA